MSLCREVEKTLFSKFLCVSDSIIEKGYGHNVFFRLEDDDYDIYQDMGMSIQKYAANIIEFDIRNVVHVLSFGFDAIRLNLDIEPSFIATVTLEALNDVENQIQGRGIDLWFITIPEFGDLADKFREFNDFFRHAAKTGQLKNISLLDFSEMVLCRLGLGYFERLTMLTQFFEQKYNMTLMNSYEFNSLATVPQDPNFCEYYAKKFLVFGDTLVDSFTKLNDCTLTYKSINDSDIYGSLEYQIQDLVNEIIRYNTRDAVHVLAFGFNAINCKSDIEPDVVASAILELINNDAKQIEGRGIDLWFVTIPETGDFASKYRKFNNCFRRAAKSGELKNVSLFDFSKLSASRPDSSRLLFEFFEQKYDLKILKPVPVHPQNMTIMATPLPTIVQKFKKLLRF